MDAGFCIIEFVDGPHGPLSDYVHIEANAAYARNAGIPDVVGQRLREMVGDEADDWVARYGAVLRTGEPIRFERELEKTGRYLELSSFRIEPAELNQVAVLFQDITARRRAEIELQALNESLEARVAEALAGRRLLAEIVDGADAMVHVVGRDGRWIAINRAGADRFEQIFGVRPAVGDRMLDLLADQPEQHARVAALWDRALAGEAFIDVGEFTAPDAPPAFYEMRFSPLHDADGRLIGAYQFVYDVTDRVAEQQRLVQTEEQLRQAQKMEAVGQLTGGLAHDFNNLLTGITGSMEMMEVRLAQGRTADLPRYIAAAQGAAKRAAALTHRLLAFSRRQTLAPKPVDVRALIGGMEELIGRSVGPSITLETVNAAGLWPALIDAGQLENAILNLCLNARDAMPDGGTITIETANRWMDARTADQRGLKAGQYISVCVSDTGTGMSPHVKANAFDPFFTTKPIGLGTGLGLSMIYGFAKQSGGSVSIYSEPGDGTMVCIYLPRHVGEAETYEPGIDTAAHLPRAEAGETVLVVDDEPTIRMLVVEVLEDLGYTAIEAGDGAAALRILRSDARIDLLVTDVGLPGGMNGRQVADAARDLRPGLNVLFVTGYAENAVLSHGHLDPGMHVITKPFSMEKLGVTVRELLSG
ncbi:MAG: response regulator, partial [Sphingomonas sp.]